MKKHQRRMTAAWRISEEMLKSEGINQASASSSVKASASIVTAMGSGGSGGKIGGHQASAAKTVAAGEN